MRPLCQKLQHRGINGDGRPLARYSRASLHGAVTAIVESEGRTACVPTVRSYFIVTRQVRLPTSPYISLHVIESPSGPEHGSYL